MPDRTQPAVRMMSEGPRLSPSTEAGKARADLVAIAASAGGIPAVSHILAALPRDFPVAIALVLHRGARVPELLPRILARETTLTVKLAEEGDILRGGTVYVAPADRHLMVDHDRTLHLTDGRRIKYLASSANPLLDSAAAALGGRVIAVVLTGTGSDGTDGVQAVRATGGIVIAQDPESAQQRECRRPRSPAARWTTSCPSPRSRRR